MGEIESKYNHNWWANRNDEVKVAEKNDKMIKKSTNDENANIFHGKKKFDFEESAANNRSYLEEFNVTLIFFDNIYLDSIKKYFSIILNH